MNMLLQKLLFNVSTAAKKFTIVKNKYLVPVKPCKALSAYFIFYTENRLKQAGNLIQVSKILGQKWKNLNQEQKKVYNDKAKQLKQKHQAQLKEYNQKYAQPLKSISFHNLITKEYFLGEKIPIAESSQKIKGIIQKMTPQEQKVFKDKAEQIRQQRQKIAQQYIIPELEFKTQRSFLMREAGEKKLSQLTEHQRTTLQKKYIKYQENYQNLLSKFASKFDLTLHDFNDIVKLHNRRKQRKIDKEIQQLQTNYQKQIKKTVALKKKAVITPKVNKASRVKKEAAIIKSVVKKGAAIVKPVVKKGAAIKKPAVKKRAAIKKPAVKKAAAIKKISVQQPVIQQIKKDLNKQVASQN